MKAQHTDRDEIAMTLGLPFRVTSILAVLLSVAAYIMAVPEMFGAHPWWAHKVVLFGAPVGIVIGVVLWTLRVPQLIRLVCGVGFLVGSFYVAKYGQTGFANSYAEDQLAGKLWYLGWIATSAALPAFIIGLSKSRDA
jgi:carbon starvation protein CstA